MQRFYDRCLAWAHAQHKAGVLTVKRDDAPDWEAFLTAKEAFTTAVCAAAKRFEPMTETVIGLAEKAKGVTH
jgi:hypothetical protein